MAVADTLAAMLSAAPELAKTPSLALAAAQGTANQLLSTPDPKNNARSTAQTTALALALLGMKMGAQHIAQAAYQPEEPEPKL